MRTGAGFGVVLDGRAGHVLESEPLHGAVVEVDVRQLGGPEVGLPAHRLVVFDRLGPARSEHGEAVVLAGDLGPARGQVLDRVVGAVVAEGQLVGLEADRPAEQLVAEADAVYRELADQTPHGLDDVVEGGRVARAVGEKDGVGLVMGQFGGARGAWMQLDGGAALVQVAHDRELHARVDHGDAWPIGNAVQDGDALRGERPGQVATAHRRLGLDQGPGLWFGDTGWEQAAAHRPVLTDMADQSARIEFGDGGDAALGEPREPAALGPGRVLAVDRGAHDRRARVNAVRLHRLGRDPVVADLGEREDDQLTGVAGIGHGLLIARHGGREHDLADGVLVGSTRLAVKSRAVLEQHICADGGIHRLSTPASASSLPRWATAPSAMVSSTRP